MYMHTENTMHTHPLNLVLPNIMYTYPPNP